MNFRWILAIFIAFTMTWIASTTAFAQNGVTSDTRTITFIQPTQRENGEALDPVTEIQQYNLYCLQVPSGQNPNDPIGGETEFKASTPYVIPGLTSDNVHVTETENILDGRGRHQCALTALDIDGLESMLSNIVSVTWLSPPGAPSDLEIVMPNPVSQLPTLTVEERQRLVADINRTRLENLRHLSPAQPPAPVARPLVREVQIPEHIQRKTQAEEDDKRIDSFN